MKKWRAVVLVIGAGALIMTGWLAKQRNKEQISGPTEEVTPTPSPIAVNFVKAGILVENEGDWRLIYEEPGAPALSLKLNFSSASKCIYDKETECEGADWKNGDKVTLAGDKNMDEAQVAKLYLFDETACAKSDLTSKERCELQSEETIKPKDR